MNGDGILKLCAALLIAVACLTLAIGEKRSPQFHFRIQLEMGYGEGKNNN
ncbi:MAG TPA: hypothetical protein VE944_32840 [Nostoc sp.]|nr:hypothetical protein [Nostoc sp.]HYX19056.1 hypothetical protein [Nostoc sp.]